MRGRFLPRTDFGMAERPRVGGFCQKFRGDPGWGISLADQDRERERAGRGLLSGLPGGLSRRSNREDRRAGLGDAGALEEAGEEEEEEEEREEREA